MSRLCNVCGAPMDDNAAFCTNCGTRFAPPAPGQPPMAPNPNFAPNQPPMAPQFEAPVGEDAPKKKPNLVKLGILAGSVVAVIAIIAIVISSLFPSPEAMTKKLMKAIEKGDAATIVSAYPDYLWEDDDEKEDYLDELQDELEDSDIEDFEYEIKKVEELDDDEIEGMELLFELVEEYNDDFESDDITDYKKVKVKVNAEIDGDDYSETWDLIYIKYQGKWKVLYGLPF